MLLGVTIAAPLSRAEDLRDFSESALLYDFEMLGSLASMTVRILLGQVEREWYEENAIRESLLVHARALTEFFYGDRRRERDVRVEDYFADGADLDRWRPTSGERPRGRSGRGPVRRWPRQFSYSIFVAVADVMEPFADEVDPSLVVADFAERVRNAAPPRQPEPYRPDLAVGQRRTTNGHPPLWFEDVA